MRAPEVSRLAGPGLPKCDAQLEHAALRGECFRVTFAGQPAAGGSPCPLPHASQAAPGCRCAAGATATLQLLGKQLTQRQPMQQQVLTSHGVSVGPRMLAPCGGGRVRGQGLFAAARQSVHRHSGTGLMLQHQQGQSTCCSGSWVSRAAAAATCGLGRVKRAAAHKRP